MQHVFLKTDGTEEHMEHISLQNLREPTEDAEEEPSRTAESTQQTLTEKRRIKSVSTYLI